MPDMQSRVLIRYSTEEVGKVPHRTAATVKILFLNKPLHFLFLFSLFYFIFGANDFLLGAFAEITSGVK